MIDCGICFVTRYIKIIIVIVDNSSRDNLNTCLIPNQCLNVIFMIVLVI